MIFTIEGFIKEKEKDLETLIKLIPKVRKVKNIIIINDIERMITENIIRETKQIKELKELAGDELKCQSKKLNR